MKTHRMDGVSFTFGIVFLAIVACYVAARLVDLNLSAMGWLAAGGLILLGMAGLVGALRSGRANPDNEPASTVTDQAPETPDAAAAPDAPAAPDAAAAPPAPGDAAPGAPN